MYRQFIITLVALLILAGCSDPQSPPLRLAVNPWIGYSPLYYAHEKGWLERENVTLVHSTSLNETIHYFQAGLIDGFVSTQYEASLLGYDKVVHAFAIDRSNGGDVVLSSHPLEQLKSSPKITAFFEIDSVNQLVFNDFVANYGLSSDNIQIINKEQAVIKGFNLDQERPVILVTYEPYATLLRNRGFQQLASTAESNLLVLDSLYIDTRSWHQLQPSSGKIKGLMIKAVQQLRSDPKEYWNTVKHYLEDAGYDDFSQSLSTIEWVLDQPVSELLEMIGERSIPKIEG